MSYTERDRRAVAVNVEAFNRGDLDRLCTRFTPDAVVQGVLGLGDLDDVMPIWRELHSAFALRLTADAVIAEGDVVAVRYTERGTSVGPFRRQSPTGRTFVVIAVV